MIVQQAVVERLYEVSPYLPQRVYLSLQPVGPRHGGSVDSALFCQLVNSNRPGFPRGVPPGDNFS